MAEAQLKAKLSLNSGSFATGLAQAKNSAVNFGKTIAGVGASVTGLAGLLAAFKGTHAIIEGTMAAFEKGHHLEKMAKQSGETISNIVVLQKAFKIAGVDSENLSMTLFNLQKALGGVNSEGIPTKEIFAQIGLRISDLQAMSPTDAIKKIGEALADLKNPSQQAAAAMQIFGRQGRDMIAVLTNMGVFADAEKSARKLGDVYQRSAEAFSRISISIDSIKAKSAGFYAGFAEQIAPILEGVLDTLKKIDLIDIGSKIGKTVNSMVGMFKAGKIGEFLSVGFELAISSAANLFLGLAKYVGKIFTKIFQNVVQYGFIEGIITGMVSVGSYITATLLKAFETPIKYFQAGIQFAFEKALEGGYFSRFLAGINPALAAAAKAFLPEGLKAQSFKDILDQTTPNIFGKTSEDFAAQGAKFGSIAGKRLSESFKKIFDDIKNITFENGGLIPQEKIDALKSKLNKMINENAIAIGKNHEEKKNQGGVIDLGASKMEFFKAISSSLQNVGGGGGFIAGGMVSTQKQALKEAQIQTQILKKIADQKASSNLALGTS